MRKILTITLLLFSTFSYCQEKVTNNKFTLNYDVKYFKSKYYPNEERSLNVFLPENYDASKKYPVVYTLDGESLFIPLIQNISVLQDKTQEDNNIIPQCIVVSIENTNRGRDLKPNTGIDPNFPLGTFIKGTEKFYKILNEEIVPFIVKNYSTSGFNVLIGHSDSGHFVTQSYLRNDNEFDAIIALSVNDFGEYFKKQIPNKLNQEKSKLLFLGYGNMDIDFNELGYYLKKLNLNNKYLKVNKYNANHTQMPFVSLFDALQFVFSNYRFYDKLIEETYNKEFNYLHFKELYQKNIFEKYGIRTKIGWDVDYLLYKSVETNNTFVFHSILDEIDRTNILQLQFRFWYCNEFNQNERAKSYLYEMLQSQDTNDKLIFFANLNKQYSDFFIDKLKQPQKFVEFIEKAKVKWPEYTLEFNYLILKVLTDNGIEFPKKKKYYRYCEQNFKKNRYFTKDNLQELNII